jgi:serine/threonine protein kinase
MPSPKRAVPSPSPAAVRRRRYDPTPGGWFGENETNVLRIAARGGGLVDAFGKANIEQCDFRWKRGEQIGQGSFGAVYQGLNEDTGALIAIKEMQFDAGDASPIAAMKEEIILLRALDHPHIVRYLGADVRGSTLYIMAEWMSCGSLRSLIEKFGPLQESVIRRYTRQILEGLAYLHSKRIIHRDIKGANVLVDESGMVKLADFGTAKRLEVGNIRSWSTSPTWAEQNSRAPAAAPASLPLAEESDGDVMLHGASRFVPETLCTATTPTHDSRSHPRSHALQARRTSWRRRSLRT